MAEYVLGQSRGAERLGAIEFSQDWSAYSAPVDLGDTEYAFARCSKSRKEAVLLNRFNETAANRAKATTEELLKKLNVTSSRPVAVYMLVFDSVSRQHFYRNFPETVEYLNSNFGQGKYEKKFALYDFAINNAHGENTQPNMVPWLFGYNLKYHKNRLQGFSIHRPDDEWQYLQLQEESLWKIYERHGFVTLFGFDTVWDFLSHSTGRRIATDHMISNFYHACRKLFGYMDFVERQRCIGLHNAHYYSLNYLRQFHRNYRGYNRFAYIHLSPGHEKSGTVIRTADNDLMLFLEGILDDHKSRKGEDLVLVIASDHGKHSNEWDKTQEGYLENQLPLHLLIANKKLVSRLGPDTHDVLMHNTKRLVSRLDWHMTFRHMATFPYGRLKEDSSLYQSWKRQTDSNSSLSVFLEKVPDHRECVDVDIPVYYCSCVDFQEVSLAEALHMQVVNDLVEVPLTQLGLRYINARIHREDAEEVCHTLSLESIQKVTMQILEPSNSRSFKVRLIVREGKNPQFEVIGLMSPHEEFYRFRADMPPNFPSVNTSFSESPEAPRLVMLLQVQEQVASRSGACGHVRRHL